MPRAADGRMGETDFYVGDNEPNSKPVRAPYAHLTLSAGAAFHNMAARDSIDCRTPVGIGQRSSSTPEVT